MGNEAKARSAVDSSGQTGSRPPCQASARRSPGKSSEASTSRFYHLGISACFHGRPIGSSIIMALPHDLAANLTSFSTADSRSRGRLLDWTASDLRWITGGECLLQLPIQFFVDFSLFTLLRCFIMLRH